MLMMRQAHAVGGLCMTAAQCAAVLAPLAAFQFHGYLRFCSGQPSSGVPLWCAERVPYIYGYVQSHYWGVGFLKYWQISQASSHEHDLSNCPRRRHQQNALTRTFWLSSDPQFHAGGARAGFVLLRLLCVFQRGLDARSIIRNCYRCAQEHRLALTFAHMPCVGKDDNNLSLMTFRMHDSTMIG